MDPVKEPMCAVCGATTDLVGRQGAGWVCAVSGPCIERSVKRSWLPARPWKEVPITSSGDGEVRVHVVEPHYHEELGAMPSTLIAWLRPVDPAVGPTDLLHPYGRCTCGGEGLCERCLEHQVCDVCLGDCYEAPCAACFSTGYLPMPDYEAMGYPETEVRTTPHSFGTIAAQVRSWWR